MGGHECQRGFRYLTVVTLPSLIRRPPAILHGSLPLPNLSFSLFHPPLAPECRSFAPSSVNLLIISNYIFEKIDKDTMSHTFLLETPKTHRRKSYFTVARRNEKSTTASILVNTSRLY